MRLAAGKKIIFLVLLLSLTLYLMRVSAFGARGEAPAGGAVRDLLAPLQQGLTWLGEGARKALSFPVSLVQASRRAEELSRRVAALEGELLSAREYRLENERLKQLLDYKSGPAAAAGLEVRAAAVIGRDPGNWFATITINRGRAHGVAENMTVLTPRGLVGRVIGAGEHSATVLLITDPRSAVGALIQETRTPGLVEGEAGGTGRLHMIHIPNDRPVQEGQVVVTSGTGSLFVKGVPIGQVTRVRRDSTGLFLEAEVKPFVDFHRLEEVLVVTGVRSP